jgi:hypothetical protein
MTAAIISSHRIEREAAWETDITAKMIYVPYPIELKETGVTITQRQIAYLPGHGYVAGTYISVVRLMAFKLPRNRVDISLRTTSAGYSPKRKRC